MKKERPRGKETSQKATIISGIAKSIDPKQQAKKCHYCDIIADSISCPDCGYPCEAAVSAVESTEKSN